MANVMLRFDMRQPEFATASQADLYQAAIEISAWAEQHGFNGVHLSEHHGTDDSYCPSPLLLASAIASRTQDIRIFISALIAPPQSSMLAVGRLAPRPFVVDGQLVVRPTLRLTLTADHRVMDGALAAELLGRIVSLIEQPTLLLYR